MTVVAFKVETIWELRGELIHLISAMRGGGSLAAILKRLVVLSPISALSIMAIDCVNSVCLKMKVQLQSIKHSISGFSFRSLPRLFPWTQFCHHLKR